MPAYITETLIFLTTLFIFVIGLGALALLLLYVVDRIQTKNAIRRNYPVIGRARHILEEMGKFLRQYFFAMDREEMPFNRWQRDYVYRAAKNVGTTAGFGSTRDIRPAGTVLFVNCPFPTLEQDAAETPPLTIGEGFCREPYRASNLFNVSAMSYGAISKPAVRALSRGCGKAGSWLNTGEGGVSPWHLEGGADIVWQLGTAKYGARTDSGGLNIDKLREMAARPEIKMLELKLSQGAKPGKGGILPGDKVTEEVARIRGIPVGGDSVSPNRHPEIDNADELLDMLNRMRDATGLPVGFKCVVGAYGWFEELFEAINRRGPESAPDFITIDSCEGGTGAAPESLMDYVGLPLTESLPMVVDLLCGHGLKDRVRVIASGKLISPADVAWALAIGADFVNSARGFMFALGCIQAMRCHLNTCPTGVTTHNRRLQRGLDVTDKTERVASYIRHMHKEVGVIAHSCGVPEPRRLRRKHARIVRPDGRSQPLDELWPYVAVGSLRSDSRDAAC